MTLLVGDKLVVSIHYTLTDVDGAILDSSEGTDPLNYLHGASNIIPGLENELTGKSIGDEFEVTVQPEEAYGERLPALIQEVPKEMFQGIDQVEVGMMFQTQAPDGQVMMVNVVDVAEDKITIDGNHPLAGQILNFKGKIEAIREATEEEVAHGHAH